jgi:ADP-ribose pyrophosphatase YjhB (NUDIX family)
MADQLEYPDSVIPEFRFQYCPKCRTELSRKVLFDDNLPRVTCPACGWIYSLSNLVAVATVVTTADGGIVMIHPPGLPAKTPAALPAGMLEYGESPQEAAVRETFEETGLEVEIVSEMGWFYHPGFNRWPGPTIYILFEARVTGGELRGSDEGPARIYALKDAPAISPQRAGSWRAMQVYLERCEKREARSEE